MKIAEDELRSVSEHILCSHGVHPEFAKLQIDLLVEAQMKGHASHGLLRLRRIVERIEAGVISPNETGQHQWRGDSQILIDGHRGLGPVVAMNALAAAQQRASDSGIVIAGIRNSNHVGMLAWYGEQIARNGFILIAATTSEALVHPWGGRQALLGTNPLCIAVPAEPEPLVLDMATSLVSMGKIHDYANRGEPLPAGWALDADGNPTTDAAAAKLGAIAPFGGAKGYALGLALEVLVTAMADSAIGTDVAGTLDSDKVCNKGDVFIVISPGHGSTTAARISSYLDEIRGSNPAGAGWPVSVPGDRARRERALSLADGIELDESVWQDLMDLDRAARAKAG